MSTDRAPTLLRNGLRPLPPARMDTWRGLHLAQFPPGPAWFPSLGAGHDRVLESLSWVSTSILGKQWQRDPLRV